MLTSLDMHLSTTKQAYPRQVSACAASGQKLSGATAKNCLTCWFGSGAVFVAVELVRRSCCSFWVTILFTVPESRTAYVPAGRPDARRTTSTASLSEAPDLCN